MKTLTYSFRPNQQTQPIQLLLGKKTLRVVNGDEKLNYGLHQVREVNIRHDDKPPYYACHIYFDDHSKLAILDDQDVAYSKFVLALHRNLMPYIKQVKFTKSYHLQRVPLTLKGTLKMALTTFFLVMLSPLILFVLMIGLLFWGPAILGFFVNSLSSLGYRISHSTRRYAPKELPGMLFPIAAREMVHEYSVKD